MEVEDEFNEKMDQARFQRKNSKFRFYRETEILDINKDISL